MFVSLTIKPSNSSIYQYYLTTPSIPIHTMNYPIDFFFFYLLRSSDGNIFFNYTFSPNLTQLNHFTAFNVRLSSLKFCLRCISQYSYYFLFASLHFVLYKHGSTRVHELFKILIVSRKIVKLYCISLTIL